MSDMKNKDKRTLQEIKEYDKKFNIDRKRENELVCQYQKTKDDNILNEIYEARVPTLEFWAKKHFYNGLACSEKDLFNELTITFIKAVKGYKKNRGDFNTCLFTFLSNRLKNIKKSLHAKKRTSEIYDGPRSGMVLSLDYSYMDDEEGNLTLQDVLPDDLYEENSAPVSMNLEDTINVLSNGDDDLCEFFKNISEGRSISSLIKEYKIKKGNIKYNGSDDKNKIKKIIQDKLKEDFILIDFKVENGSLEYKVELKKEQKAEAIIKKIRELKRNKEYYLNKLDDIV